MSKDQSTYYVIGLMSGSSLDGLDIAFCQFNYTNAGWNFTLLQSQTAPLEGWEVKLRNAVGLSDSELELLGKEFATYLAEAVNVFMEDFGIERMDAIVSHGHTIYHYPDKGKTCQIGDGQVLADLTQSGVINNLRQKDIDAGGQGAPIVPIGDLHLFKQDRYCLNLGGIANLSVKTKDSILAFDICATNQVLNHYANNLGKAYDNKGHWASEGHLNLGLLKRLNEVEFYTKDFPKSLDNGFSKKLIALIDSMESNDKNVLRTYVEHIADQIALAIEKVATQCDLSQTDNESILLTGGGAFNKFLVARLQAKLKLNIHIPYAEIINYKEAIVMAFIGVLRLRNEVNVLASVTGAAHDTCCGECYYPMIN